MSLLPSTDATARVLALLPAHVRARDAESGGLLAALAGAVGGELDVLERDVDALYASWFVETCPEWVVPYLADLVGVGDLPPDLPGVTSRRAFVANTVRYRQGKGTVAVVEQVARDASGWPATAVEFYRLLATTAHVNHVRTDRPATAAIRTPVAGAGPLELLPTALAQGALHRVAHTAEVRRIASGRGRYGIPNVGAFLFGHQVYELGWAPPTPPAAPGEGWSVHPLRSPTPLFAAPRVEAQIEHLATEPDLPVPVRPRRLLALLAAARDPASAGAAGPPLPLAVRVGGVEVDAERIRVHRLESLARGPSGGPLDGWQVMVDAVAGRLYPFRDGLPAQPASFEVRHAYGGTADVGAGSHDRTLVHEQAVADDPYRGDPARGGPGVTDQLAVLADDPQGIAQPGIADALDAAETAWAGPDSPAGGTFVVAVGDSARYPVAAAGPADVAVAVPQATRLLVVAAAWRERIVGPGEVLPPVKGTYAAQGLRPRLAGSLTVTGEGGSSVVVDGLVIEGDVVVGPGELGSLTLSSCTIAGAVRVGADPGTSDATNAGVVVRIVRSQCAAVAVEPAAATVEVVDSTVDAAGGDAVAGAGLSLSVQGSTVVGAVRARTLQGSDAIFDGRVVVENRQVGCLRYSYAPRSSRVPRRYRCSPSRTADPRVRPSYVATDRGSPSYLALAPGCPTEITEGGEGGAEMGVHHHLGRPLRVRAATRLLAPYLPVGLELGVHGPVAAGRS